MEAVSETLRGLRRFLGVSLGVQGCFRRSQKISRISQVHSRSVSRGSNRFQGHFRSPKRVLGGSVAQVFLRVSGDFSDSHGVSAGFQRSFRVAIKNQRVLGANI